jgi:hypothetical protein
MQKTPALSKPNKNTFSFRKTVQKNKKTGRKMNKIQKIRIPPRILANLPRRLLKISV